MTPQVTVLYINRLRWKTGPHLHAGDACPGCERGKVYPQKEPRTLVRIVGQAPLAATVCELDRLRCNLCGEVFTAPEPEGVGPEKYDETTAAMIALLKYGSAMPFYRLEKQYLVNPAQFCFSSESESPGSAFQASH